MASSGYTNPTVSSQSSNNSSSQVSVSNSAGRGGSASTQQSWSGLDPAIMDEYMTALTQAMNGGDAAYQTQVAKRNDAINSTNQLMQQYTKEAAFSDAAALMKLNLQQSMEKQMPAIARSVQGAGTSSSSMQALLSQKLANDSALAAGALGAEQAAKYGNTSAALSGVLNNLTAIDPTLSNLVASLISSGKSSTSSGQSTSFNNTDSHSSSSSNSIGSSVANSSGGGGASSSTDPVSSGGSRGGSSGGGRAGSNVANTSSGGVGWSNMGGTAVIPGALSGGTAGITDLGTGITTWPGGLSNDWNDLDGYNSEGGWGSSSPEYDPYYNPGTYTGDMGNMDGGDAWAWDDSYSSGGDDYYYDY